jgi:hypothetical protein
LEINSAYDSNYVSTNSDMENTYAMDKYYKYLSLDGEAAMEFLNLEMGKFLSNKSRGIYDSRHLTFDGP